ncbi:MAG: hypothetical protein IKO55_07940, partial [Kiritimatiellae bacterium]|nr:hypothetical protein [Kiritimatiellia bacterium]
LREGNMESNNGEQVGYGITHTLEETAKRLGITRERVRQIEKKALEKLRMRLRARYGITSLAGIL